MPNSEAALPSLNLLEQAQLSYPYLRDKKISIIETLDESDGRQLEYWAPQDQGWMWKGKLYKRPTELPLDTTGIQILSGKARPIDVLADYVSHQAVNEDPVLSRLYRAFSNTLDEKKMRERYAYHKDKLGEDRTYSDWIDSTGIPEMFRGYTFDQWGANSKELYTPEQLHILNTVREYLGIDRSSRWFYQGQEAL